ncbi:type I-E CRISPR-associated protein Cas6/Cse3/CasE [Nakamurella antarctica]|uniref:Type I-E CRISPR-associated protein Cas6/Cse3/CasE n=1 Tax=Nakamurella antarctica TaxID=1902245 RepID=A0A3G8ZJJ5_9ACTN|nr:type I-E CRISPR-associated protein Cas6/Cse3/CasE [Nakamurella antarctica]AZI57529.1 type I-E CRISPR-associated protein Cas6/Cse3/CasE [Nakamurella antarctica]
MGIATIESLNTEQASIVQENLGLFLAAIPITQGMNWGRDHGADHRTVMGLFGQFEGDPSTRRAEAGILFRSGPGARGVVLVQSKVKPINLPSGAAVITDGGLVADVGSEVTFQIAVNAVISKSRSNFRTPAADPVEWARKKLAPALWVQDAKLEDIKITTSAMSGALVISSITGIATVTKREALADFVTNGVGRAKAFGAGLLTIQK